jgi:hsp70-interacting protein
MIELIDNANNMTVLKMWEPILSLLDSPEDGIVAHACWIIGTAVQNNLKAQAAVCLPSSPIETLLTV